MWRRGRSSGPGGNAEFGYAWDRNLTDEDGPYVELMAGAFTDNQPDFSWLHPYETRTFSQYWYPMQKIGPAKNANTEAAVNLEFDDSGARVGVCVTSPRSMRVLLTRAGQTVMEHQLELTPGRPFTRTMEGPAAKPHEYRLTVLDADGRDLIAYQPNEVADRKLPDPATEPLPPEQIASVEELYLTGLHLEQYRHATRSPEACWREGLKRDPEDARINDAMGLRWNWSAILETIDAKHPQTVLFRLTGGLAASEVHVWETNNSRTFEQVASVKPANGEFEFTFDPDSLYPLTTITGQGKGTAVSPPPAAFPLPFADDFEDTPLKHTPKYRGPGRRL